LDKSIILLTLLIISLPCFAIELGSEFLTARSYSDQFRPLLLNKIKQMDQNFIRNINQGSITYISRNDEVCLDGSHVEKNQPLMQILFDQKLKDKNYEEVRSYVGCNGRVVFQEVLFIKGIDSLLHSQDDFYNYKLDLSKASTYDEIQYFFIDDHGARTFAINGQKSNKLSEMNFFLNNQLFMKRIIENDQWVSYSSYPLHFKMNRNGYRFETRSSKRFHNQLRANVTKNNIEYYNPEGERISLASFQENFTVSGFNFIMDSFLAYYPKTEFVTSNLQSSKLLNELRDAQTFLINGVQLNLVRNLIEEYIEAVKKGEIVDNRK
jgi:hypothetical protein